MSYSKSYIKRLANPDDTLNSTFFNAGRCAAKKGKTRHACLFAKGSAENELWFAGFNYD